MTPSRQWSAGQLAVLHALEVPLYLRRQSVDLDSGEFSSTSGPVDSGWSLCASAARQVELRQQRWYVQLCRFRTPSAETTSVDDTAAIIIAGQALTLEGDPPRPSAEIKRAIYQALRSRSPG